MTPDAPAAILIEDLLLQASPDFRLTIPRLEVHAGQIVALVGANGSGKTTLIETLMGLRAFQRGRIRLNGRELATIQANPALRRSIGCQLQRNSYANQFKVGEILALHRSLYGSAAAGVAGSLGIDELRPHKYARLSGGQKQRVDLYVAMEHAPALLFLDEPTTGLDRRFAETLFALLAEWTTRASGRSVMIASHKPEEVALADRVVLLRDGTIVDVLDMPSDLVRVVGKRRYDLRFSDGASAAAAEAELVCCPHVRTIMRNHDLLTLFTSNDFHDGLAERYNGRLTSYAFAEVNVGDLLALASRASH